MMNGSTISIMNLIRGLLKKNIQVVVVAPKMSKEIKDFVNKYNIKAYSVPLIRQATIHSYSNRSVLYNKYRILRYYINKIKHYPDYRKLCSIIKAEHPNIVHTDVGVVQDGYYAAKKYNIPHVWHLREYQDKDFDLQIMPSKEKLIKLLNDSYVISITKDILKHFDLKEDSRHRVIYNGIMSRNNTCYNPQKEDYFLCASRISPEKGHVDVVKAFSLIHKKHPKYRLKILGIDQNGFMSYLQSLSKELGCYNNIDFIGYTTDVSSYMKKAKALVVASKFEGFGRMTAEAFFNGCMVIGRNTGGTKEILDLTGGVSYLGNYEVLAEKMEQIINLQLSEYSNIVLKAQKVAAFLYSNESNAEKTYDFYKEIVQDKRLR